MMVMVFQSLDPRMSTIVLILNKVIQTVKPEEDQDEGEEIDARWSYDQEKMREERKLSVLV